MDMRRRWRAWWCSGELKRGHGGASGSRSGASEQVRRDGATVSVRAGGGSVARGGSRSAVVCGMGARRRASWASQEASVGPGGPHVVPPGAGGGGGSPPLSMDLPRRAVAPGEVDVAAVVAGGTGPMVVPGRGGPGGPLPPERGGRADTVLGRGGAARGGRRGSGVERLVGGAGIPCAGAVRARGLVAGLVGWWAVVVVLVGVVLGVVVVVVVAVVVAGALVAVVLVVVVMVLWARP